MSRPVSDPRRPPPGRRGSLGRGQGLPARGSPLSLPPFTHHARNLASSDPLELVPEDFRPYELPQVATPASTSVPWTLPSPATVPHRRTFSAEPSPSPVPISPQQRPSLTRPPRSSSLYAHPKLSHPFNHLPTPDMFSFVQSATAPAAASRRLTAKASAPPAPVSPVLEQVSHAAAAAPASPKAGSQQRHSRAASPNNARFVRKLWRGRSGDTDWDFGCAGELELDEAAFASHAGRPKPIATHHSTASFGSSNRHSTASTSSSVHPPSLTHSRGSSPVSSVCLSPILPGSPTFNLQLAAGAATSLSPLSSYTSRVPLTPRSEAKAKFQAYQDLEVPSVDGLEVCMGRSSRLSRVEEVLSERGSERGSWEPRRPGGVQVEFDLSGLDLDLDLQFDDHTGSTFTPVYVPLDLELDLQSRRESDAASEATVTAPNSSTFAREFTPLAVDTATTFFPASTRDGNHSPPLHSDDIAATLEELSIFFAPSNRTSQAHHAPPLQPVPAGSAAKRHGHLLHSSGSASAPCSPLLNSSPRLGSTQSKRPSQQYLQAAAFQPKVLAARVDSSSGSRRRSAATYSWI